MAFCEESDLAASGHDDGTLCLWRPATGALVWRKRVHTDTVTCLAAAAFGGRAGHLLSGALDGRVAVVDLVPTPAAVAAVVAVLDVCRPGPNVRGAPLSAAASRAGSATPSASAGAPSPGAGAARPGSSRAPTRPGSARPPSALRGSPTAAGGSRRATASQQPAPGAEVWRLTSRPASPSPLPGASRSAVAAAAAAAGVASAAAPPPPGASPQEIVALAFDPRRQLLATGHYDGSIHVFDALSFERLGAHWHSEAAVTTLACDGRLLFSGHADGSIALWPFTPEDWAEERRCAAAAAASAAAAAAAAAGAGGGGKAAAAAVAALAAAAPPPRLFAGRPLRVMAAAHEGPVNVLCVEAGGELMSGGRDGRWCAYDYARGRLLREFVGAETITAASRRHDRDEHLLGTAEGLLIIATAAHMRPVTPPEEERLAAAAAAREAAPLVLTVPGAEAPRAASPKRRGSPKRRSLFKAALGSGAAAV